jgi:hypothetical protein
VKVRLRLEDFETHEEIKAARKLINRKTKEGMKEAAQRAVLPEAKRGAPAIVAQALTTKATTRGAYLTTLGRRKLDDITGLLNFGGQPEDVIRPQRRKALAFRGAGGAVVVEAVGRAGRPRARYKGAHFLEAAIARCVPAMEAITAVKIREAFGALGS